MVTERRVHFSARLKAAREKTGISLEQIAAATKINASLLRGLERSDLSRWPAGLFRRSYLRDYLRAIGLPIEPTVAEFVRLFPDEAVEPVDRAGEPEDDGSAALTLTLAHDPAARFAAVRRRIAAAAFDTTLVVIATIAAASLIPADVWVSGSVVAVTYYSIATASVGRSFGSQWIEARGWRRWKRATRATAAEAPLDPFLARLRQLKELPARRSHPLVGQLARVQWAAILLRIWFLK